MFYAYPTQILKHSMAFDTLRGGRHVLSRPNPNSKHFLQKKTWMLFNRVYSSTAWVFDILHGGFDVLRMFIAEFPDSMFLRRGCGDKGDKTPRGSPYPSRGIRVLLVSSSSPAQDWSARNFLQDVCGQFQPCTSA